MKYLLLTLLLAFSIFSLNDASARVFIGGGVVVGAPYYQYPPYYSYYPPYPPQYPAYGYTPYGAYPAYPSNYAPAYAAPQPTPGDRYYEDPQGEYCREYSRHVTIDGQSQLAYGHACRQPDGSWRTVD